jgi:uncharacterized protein
MNMPVFTGQTECREISMEWSRYNRIFRSEHGGCFLYNSMSNTLFELDESRYRLLEGWQKGRPGPVLENNAFWDLLRKKNVLVEPGEEESLLLTLQYNRQAACFDSSTLSLTICPTLRCNFRCPYCFEKTQKTGAGMTKETEERLVDFVRLYKGIRHLSVGWYGGEPLLEFPTICSLTDRFRELGPEYDGAGLVTNGFLLDAEKISRLNDLNITTIQITLDGPRKIHDSRRALAGGGPTFDRILSNITALFDSDYAGRCAVRVNIDKNNVDHFIALRTWLLEQYAGKPLSVYPGHVETGKAHSYDHSCTMDTGEWTGFSFDVFRREGTMPAGGMIPAGNGSGLCIATSQHGFVVGPGGELYKCWEDVGVPDRVVGNICHDNPVSNPVRIAQYITGTDPFSDPVCSGCTILPVCGGSCANKRMRAKFCGETGLEYCSPYKDHLTGFLDAYIRTIRTKELCEEYIDPAKKAGAFDGFRIIAPLPQPDTPGPAGPATSPDLGKD